MYEGSKGLRKENSIKNFITTFIPFIIIAILGFVRVRIYLDGLGEVISSLNQVFNNIISYLAIAESGIGLFIGQKYYKLLVEENQKKINSCFKASKVFFNSLGIFIVIAGMIVSFFLNYLTNNDLDLMYMQLAFFLFLVKNAVDFFMYAPRVLINADQKMFKVNILINLTRVVEIVTEILLIKLGFNYLVVLIPGIFIRILFNLIINNKIYKLYPWLNNKSKFNKDELKGSKNIFAQKVAGLIFYNTDTLIVSAFLTPAYVIVYTSYNFITKYLADISFMLVSAIQPSLGNIFYLENKDYSYKAFKKVNTLFLYIASVFTILTISLIDPFIGLWVGKKYISTIIVRYLFGLILFVSVSSLTILSTKDNLGLFKETKFAIMTEAILNLILSLTLVSKFGISGILFATAFSRYVSTFWYVPVVVFRSFFNKSSLQYFIQHFICLLNVYLISFLLDHLSIFAISSFLNWFLLALIYGGFVVAVVSIEFYFLFPEFRSLLKKYKNK